jgi:5'-3' exonuclease
MGIKGLPQFLKQHHADLFVPVAEATILQSRIAIDTGVFMHRFTVNMHYPDEYISRFLQFALMLRNLRVNYVFIFDGKPCSAKGQTLRNRREKRARNLVMLQQKIRNFEEEERGVFDLLQTSILKSTSTEKDGDFLARLQYLRSKRLVLMSRTIPINRGFFYRLQEIFSRENIPYIEADGEAEKACAWLSSSGLVDLVVTEDYDALVCGSPRVLRYWHHHDHYCVPSIITLQSVLERLGLTYEKFVTVCVLAGSDFAQSPPYIGFRRALSFVTSDPSGTVDDVFAAHYQQFYETPELANSARKAFDVAHGIFANARFPFVRNLMGLFFANLVSFLLRIFLKSLPSSK